MTDEERTSFADKRNFAKHSVSYTNPHIKTSRRYSKQNIATYLESPYKNSASLQEVSAFLRANSGVYNRLIKYFTNMPTFDLMLYPLDVGSKSSNSGNSLAKSYQETALYLEKLNPKYNLRWFLERILQNGELYLYKIQDTQSTVYKEMPTDYCRISSIEDNVCKYAVNLRALQSNNVYNSMPEEIQKIVDKYTNGQIKEEDIIDNSWYELPENAVAFNGISPFLAKGYPMFSYLFDGLMHLDEMKVEQWESTKANNLKIIHQKIPIDDDGELLIDYDLVKEYHASTKRNLPNGIAITTNPLDLQSITLSRTGAEAINQRSDALDSLYDDAGVNSELFNGNKSTTEAVAMGIKADDMFIHDILSSFENFLNWEIAQNKKTSVWRVKMFNTTNFTKDEQSKRSKDNLAFGGSRLEFLASQGYTPLQGMNVLKGELELGLDKIMIPQQTSYTSSKGDVGAPTVDEKEDRVGGSKTPEKSV